MKKGVFAIIIGHILGLFYLVFNDKIEIELANFVITFFAFCAAIYAIYYQHQESKQAEENFKKQFAQAEKHFQEQFSLQKEAALKQETIGAWQVLANKASGNSGKKEAIEFLASQGIPLIGIDMSYETHGASVYLVDLFKDFTGDRSKIDLRNANFSGANLENADFSHAKLVNANFGIPDEKKHPPFYIKNVNFSGARLHGIKFKNIYIKNCNFSYPDEEKDGEPLLLVVQHCLDTATKFTDCYCDKTNSIFTYHNSKFTIDERTNKNGEPIYPENNPDYRYIKLKIK